MIFVPQQHSCRVSPGRNQLTILAAATCLPILVFAATLIFLLNRHFVAVEQNRLGDTAQHMAEDIDREISATIRTLEVLATSDYLDKGDLRGFHRQAANALLAIRPWEAIVLTDPSGQQIANTRRTFDSPLPMTGTPDFNTAIVKTRRMAVSNLFSGGVVKTPVIAVGVPVIREGQVVYTLSSSTAPTFLTDLLKKSNLPAGWLATVIDRNQIIVARVLNIDKYLGQAATPLLAAKSKEAPRGSFKGVTRKASTFPRPTSAPSFPAGPSPSPYRHRCFKRPSAASFCFCPSAASCCFCSALRSPFISDGGSPPPSPA